MAKTKTPCELVSAGRFRLLGWLHLEHLGPYRRTFPGRILTSARSSARQWPTNDEVERVRTGLTSRGTKSARNS